MERSRACVVGFMAGRRHRVVFQEYSIAYSRFGTRVLCSEHPCGLHRLCGGQLRFYPRLKGLDGALN